MADPSEHAGHNPLDVAGAVDRGARLASVLERCVRCTSLYVDLGALIAALPLSALPTRPRSFTLTVDDTRRLRPAGWRGRWSAVGSARDTLTRPLAIGVTTLGLVGLLLTAAPTLLAGVGGAASSGAAPESEPSAASIMPGARTTGAVDGDAPRVSQASTAPSPEGSSPTLLLSVGLLLVGGGLFAIRRFAVRGRPVR